MHAHTHTHKHTHAHTHTYTHTLAIGLKYSPDLSSLDLGYYSEKLALLNVLCGDGLECHDLQEVCAITGINCS